MSIQEGHASTAQTIGFTAIDPLDGSPDCLVFLFHGLGTNGAFMRSTAEEIAVRLPQARIVMLEGVEAFRLPSAGDSNYFDLPQTLRGHTVPESQRQWFSIDGDWASLHRAVMNLTPVINRFIDAERDHFGLRDDRLALMGFSQGGGLALVTAYARPETVACVVAHSTLFFADPSFSARPETLFIYGSADEDFSHERYLETIVRLQSYLGTLDVRCIDGLTHKTNATTRVLSADFIARHLQRPS